MAESHSQVLRYWTVNPLKQLKLPECVVMAGKKVKGRKRHILVDTMGLLLMIVVHTANIQDRDGARQVLGEVKRTHSCLILIWADGGYVGQLVDWVKASCGWILEIIKLNDDIKGFQILPHRWVVECTSGWFGRYRRLSKNYEGLMETAMKP